MDRWGETMSQGPSAPQDQRAPWISVGLNFRQLVVGLQTAWRLSMGRRIKQRPRRSPPPPPGHTCPNSGNPRAPYGAGVLGKGKGRLAGPPAAPTQSPGNKCLTAAASQYLHTGQRGTNGRCGYGGFGARSPLPPMEPGARQPPPQRSSPRRRRREAILGGPSLPFLPCFSRESKMAPLPGILLLLLLCLSAGGPTVCALESETSAQDEAVHGRILPAHGGNGSSEGVPQPGPDGPPWPEAESSLAHPTEAAGSAAGTQEDLPATAATAPPSAQEDLPHPGGNGAAGALEEQPGPTAAGSGSEEAEGGQPGCEGDVPPQKMHRVAEAMMQFTADLLRVLEREDPGGNLCFSPLSISLALAHLALGAANQTEKHLLEALHMESVPCLHQTLQALSRQLDNPLLNVAARLYLRKGFQVREKFLEDSERFYGAKPVTLSGQNDADLAAINDWVKETTQGQISTILSSLPASAVMVLLNAVHFKGFWRNKFDPALTAPGTFHLDEEFVVSVNMMKALKYPLSWFNLESLDVQAWGSCFLPPTSAALPRDPSLSPAWSTSPPWSWRRPGWRRRRPPAW
ncbi:alpha-2-antiplasmin isoform X2 [Hemicordylus capensis]|uniref:alpha-2-antiplasmin isoform X2 n=1 Tax=Hemicordylus capensis TaxID=884348 RepID=UPI002303F6B5|nr:alpha-2-antiplasmin isoform X2 [Hemicordylus capensis]